MLIREVFIRDSHLILRDVDGSEVALTALDALYLRNWLGDNVRELKEVVQKQAEQQAEEKS